MISLKVKFSSVAASVATSAALGVGGYYYWTGTPTYSLMQLNAAIQIQDQTAVARYVDKDSVVDSLVDPLVDLAVSEYMGEISTKLAASNDTWGMLGVGIGQSIIQSMIPSIKSQLKNQLIEGFEERLQGKGSLDPSHYKLEQNGSSAKICFDNTQEVPNFLKLKLVCLDMAQNTDRSWTLKRFSDVTVNKAKTEIKKLVIEQAGKQYTQNQPQDAHSDDQALEQRTIQPPVQSVQHPSEPLNLQLKTAQATSAPTMTALIFDPPSNVRNAPNGAIICSISTQTTIKIYGRIGEWYKTDACSSSSFDTLNFIHESQVSVDAQTNTYWGTLHSNDGKINLRTGPGTINKAIGYGINGDRVQVLDSGQDSGGYYWYRVRFPKSSAVGWVAAQLINIER